MNIQQSPNTNNLQSPIAKPTKSHKSNITTLSPFAATLQHIDPNNNKNYPQSTQSNNPTNTNQNFADNPSERLNNLAYLGKILAKSAQKCNILELKMTPETYSNIQTLLTNGNHQYSNHIDLRYNQMKTKYQNIIPDTNNLAFQNQNHLINPILQQPRHELYFDI